MSNINVQEIQGNEATDALRKTALDIMIAAQKRDGHVMFWAAHSSLQSFCALQTQDGSITVFKLTGGTKKARKTRVNEVRELFGAEFI